MGRSTQNFDEELYLLVQLFFLFFSNKWREGQQWRERAILKLKRRDVKKNQLPLTPLGFFFFAKMAVNLGLNCKIFYIGVLHNVFSEFNGVHKKILICVWGTTPEKGFNHEKI